MQQYRSYRRSNFDELQKNEATSRAGKGWEADEEEKLLSMRLEKSTYDEIALELKRTSRSIQTRLYLHICKLVEVENEDESALISKYDIDNNDFATFKTQRQESNYKQYRIPVSRSRAAHQPYKADNSHFTSSYENKNFNMKSELNSLRQEVYELRKIVMAK
jgi:hypothetical protein